MMRLVRVIVIAANGPAFCAGHNLKEMTAARQDPPTPGTVAALFHQGDDAMFGADGINPGASASGDRRGRRHRHRGRLSACRQL